MRHIGSPISAVVLVGLLAAPSFAPLRLPLDSTELEHSFISVCIVLWRKVCLRRIEDETTHLVSVGLLGG